MGDFIPGFPLVQLLLLNELPKCQVPKLKQRRRLLLKPRLSRVSKRQPRQRLLPRKSLSRKLLQKSPRLPSHQGQTKDCSKEEDPEGRKEEVISYNKPSVNIPLETIRLMKK